jgi:hypothetical protein
MNEKPTTRITAKKARRSTVNVTIKMSIDDEPGWQRLAKVLGSALTPEEQRQLAQSLMRRVELERDRAAAAAEAAS